VSMHIVEKDDYVIFNSYDVINSYCVDFIVHTVHTAKWIVNCSLFFLYTA
jgi:hypothetical protein